MAFDFQTPLPYAMMAAALAAFGVALVAWAGAWTERSAGLLAVAAGGMLLSFLLLHIAPEALASGDVAPRWMLAGFLSALCLNAILSNISGAGLEGPGARGAIAPLAAVALHSFLDGVVYAVAFASDPVTGVYAVTPLILHEAPEGIIVFALLARAGTNVRDAVIWAILAAAATTPLGVVVSGPVLRGLDAQALNALFGLSAGLLLFVATGPLLAPLRSQSPSRALPALALGVAAALIIIASPLGHDHGHDHHGHDHEHVDRIAERP
ncbi:MAG: ZIP family metal transporter [Pseudomonadota bacterium]